MYRKRQDLINKFVAVFVSFLTLFANINVNCVYADDDKVANPTVTGASAVTVSDAEVKAFKIGAIFMAAAGVLVMGAYFPAKEVKHAVDYYAMRRAHYNNFLKSFPDCIQDKQSLELPKQEGRLWDWAACLAYVVKSQKNSELKQKDIVNKLFGKCAFFEHNRSESLPTNGYYDSGLLDSINKLSAENGMTFERELVAMGLTPDCKEIRRKIIGFYDKNGKIPFAVSDSYFYNGAPFIHFVVVSEIDDKGIVTVRDPGVGLARKQPLDVFCQGYVHENGHAKLPSIDMFTLKPVKS